ncbi:transcriptional regulator FnrL [Halovulum sp. GXIMD14794]
MQVSQRVPTSDACEDCPIRHRAVCAHCQGDELQLLESMKSYRTYKPGDPIVWAGTEFNFVASVVSGVASMSQTMEDGRRQMVGLLLPSDFLGRPGRARAAFDVTAATDVTLCRFERKPFETLLKSSPSIGQRLLQMTLDELDAAREWMLLLGRKTAREKIASLLAILARREATLGQKSLEGEITFDLQITREAMADYLGLTIETVSRQLTALRKDEIIVLTGNRHVTVPDYDALAAEAGDDTDGTQLS